MYDSQHGLNRSSMRSSTDQGNLCTSDTRKVAAERKKAHAVRCSQACVADAGKYQGVESMYDDIPPEYEGAQ